MSKRSVLKLNKTGVTLKPPVPRSVEQEVAPDKKEASTLYDERQITTEQRFLLLGLMEAQADSERKVGKLTVELANAVDAARLAASKFREVGAQVLKSHGVSMEGEVPGFWKLDALRSRIWFDPVA